MFKSRAQHRKFRALVAEGKMDKSVLNEWMRDTKKVKGKKDPIKSLPEKKKLVKVSSAFKVGFHKVAGGPGSGVLYPNTLPIDFLETSPIVTIGKRKAWMEDHTISEKNISIDYKKIKYKGQDNMVPKKVVKIMIHADEALKKPIDIILDDDGAYHILDGHHRAIVAILLKRRLRANIYRVHQSFN